MDAVETARQLWRHKPRVALVLVAAVLAAALVAYRVSVSPIGLDRRALQVGAASSQILVDTPRSTLVAGASPEQFDALAARARVYGEYLSTLQARARIAAVSGIPARTITASGPFSPESGQVSYENQTSASRAGELLQEGAQNRLVFTAQEGVPIISVDAQAATAATAIRLAQASFVALRQYVRGLEPSGGRANARDVIVRQLGAPEGGTIGGSNDKVLMLLAFLSVAALGCALILILPRFVQRWRSLDEAERGAVAGEGAGDPRGRRDLESLGPAEGPASASEPPGEEGEEGEEEPPSNGASANGSAAPAQEDEPADAPTERTARR